MNLSEWPQVLFLLCAGVAVVWGLTSIVVFISLRLIKRVRLSEPSDQKRPKVSVIVPARNEEETIEAGLRSLTAQTGVELEIIVVNDHSTDRTGEIADRIASEDARVKVIHNPELPTGWLGKLNAMHQAAQRATGDYLLFGDADITHDPRAIALALDAMEADQLDLLSLMPKFDWVTLWENAIVPNMFLAVCIFAHPKMHDPKSDEAVGAGAFLLVRAEPYRAIGGHEPLRKEPVDDMMLARSVKRAGYRVDFRLAPELVFCRMFRSNADAFWGLSKNILDSIEGKPWAPVLLTPGLVFILGAGIFTALAGLATMNPPLIAAGAGLHLLQYLTFYVPREIFRFHRGWLLLYPLGVINLSACIVRAVYLRLRYRSVVWRGRTIQLD